ncbi:MAG: FAD-dependent oxidoreductase [Desulfitobacteriaceae bacterium]
MGKIIVVGGNFAGLTSALELKRKLGNSHEVIMISKLPYFLFVPSLIWVPLGKREINDIIVPLEPVTSKAQVDFICSEVTQILPEEKIVRCLDKDFSYDYLIIATGPEWSYNQVEGIGRENNISYIVTPETSMETRKRWTQFMKNPGPVVIGATQGAQCTGPAYEFLFNFEKRCRDVGIRHKVDITFITPEPFLGHLGMEGITGSNVILKKLLPIFKISYIINSEIEKVTGETIQLKTGQNLPFQFSMIMPIFKGAKVVRNSKDLGNDKDFLPVNDAYQHKTYPNIFGVGIAADYPVQFKTPVPVGLPKTGYAADVSAKTAAENIVRLINGNNQLKQKPMGNIPDLCIMDAGDKEMFSIADRLLKPRKFSIVLPNPVYDIGKIIFEKYYLWKVKRGYSWMP